MRLKEFFILFLSALPAVFLVAIYSINDNRHQSVSASTLVNNIQIDNIQITNIPLPSITPTPTITPTGRPTIIPTRTPVINTPVPQENDWGVAKQINEHTYTIKIDYDTSMASGQEILFALNAYRQTHGKGSLSWDQRLADYATGRANLFKSIGNTDSHAGFENFLNNEDGFSKLGFNRLGENSYFGGPLTGTHLIEWVFAKSPGHNANQLDSWSHVGIGVTDTAVNLNFGAN